VVAADISGGRLEELAVGNPGLALIPVTADVATGDGVAAVVASTSGRVDALANVAGIMDAFLPPAEIDDQTWERVFAVNVTSMMRLTRAVLPIMLEAGGGAIVNVSSEASLRCSAAGVAYTASKHAVNGLTKSTAFFYQSRGIRANAVVPGGVLTNIEGAFRSEQAAAIVGPVLQATLPQWRPRNRWPRPSRSCCPTTRPTSTARSSPAMEAGLPSEGGPPATKHYSPNRAVDTFAQTSQRGRDSGHPPRPRGHTPSARSSVQWACGRKNDSSSSRPPGSFRKLAACTMIWRG
jgi:NAD(P)-dependent dehydrogenase (short-subunit alcohol dehydrogenase family)